MVFFELSLPILSLLELPLLIDDFGVLFGVVVVVVESFLEGRFGVLDFVTPLDDGDPLVLVDPAAAGDLVK